MLLVIFPTLFIACLANDFPSFLPRCFMDDPNKVGNCILEATKTLKSRIGKGINEIGIPSYDPLVIDHFDIKQESSMVNYTTSLWNYTIRGFSDYDITEIKYNPATKTFSGNIKFNSLPTGGIYVFEGRLLHIPVSGNGTFEALLGPIIGTFTIQGKMLKLGNVDFYDPTVVKITLSIADMRMHFGGLFGGDSQKAAMTNELLNEHSKMITDAVTPVLEGLSEKLIMRYIKWLSKTFPYYKLFPLSKV